MVEDGFHSVDAATGNVKCELRRTWTLKKCKGHELPETKLAWEGLGTYDPQADTLYVAPCNCLFDDKEI